MASANLLKKFTKATTAKNADGGYKNIIYYAPVETFLSIKKTTASPSALGDRKKIVTAHTFNDDEGFISLLSKLHSVTTKTSTTGDEGAQSLIHEFEGIILGDSAEHLEQLEALINGNAIWLVKDQDCIGTDFVQFGDECVQPNIKIEFTGHTTKEGLKEYKISGSIKAKKFFYTSTVTEKPEPAPEVRATAQQYNLASAIARPTGTVLTVLAAEPVTGNVTLCTYTKVSGDTDAVTLALHLNAAINALSGTHGYSSALSDNTGTNDAFTVTAKVGLRATINGNNLTISWSGGSVVATFSGGS